MMDNKKYKCVLLTDSDRAGLSMKEVNEKIKTFLLNKCLIKIFE